MMNMAMPYELTGRTHQKARTREALIQATRELLAEGVTPTVEQAAVAAEVSRTTAYRYFPNQRALLVATLPQIAATSLLPDPPPEDPVARVEAVAEALASQVVEHEPELRAQLRLSLEPEDGERRELPYRTGRAIAWIEDALAPLRGRMPEPELRRLTLAIRSAVGIEALVWLTDIAGLSREQAADLMRWSAQALLQSALAQQDSTDNPAG
jgi:AcrR family transcriptional regulator